MSSSFHSPIFFAVLVASLSVFAQSGDRTSKLLQAAEKGEQSVLKMLPAQTDWNQTNAAGETALMRAVALGHTPFVKALLKKKVNLDQRDQAGNTALLYAVSNNEKVAAFALINAGASLDLKFGDKKENLLFEVARLGAKEIGEELIKRQPRLLHQTNSEGKTPLFQAIESDQHDLALQFIEKGASTAVVTKSGQTLLEFAKRNALDENSALFRKLKAAR